MYWTRRRAFLSLLAACILGGIAVWAAEKCKARPDNSLAAMPTLEALADGTLPVPEPTPIPEPSAEAPVSDPGFLATIRNALLPVATANAASDASTPMPLVPPPPPVPVAEGTPPSAPPLTLPAPPGASERPALAESGPRRWPPGQPPPVEVAAPPAAPGLAGLPTSPALPPPGQPAPTTSTPVPCPWNLHLEIVAGRTQLEARSGKEVHFQVSCAHLNLQAPQGCLQAQGTVEVSGAGLEGTCERLTISWEHDKVLLEGNVHLKCHKDGQDVELTADRLSVRLNTLAPAEAAEAVETLPVAPKLKSEE